MTRALPALRTWTPGDLLTAAFMTAINYAITFGCLQPPQVQVLQTVGQTISSGTGTALLADTEVIDTDGFHSTTVNTTRLTAPWNGTYELSGGTGWSAPGTVGRRGGWWSVNGTAVNGSEVLVPANASGATYVAMRTIRVTLSAGDYVELFGYHESGGSSLATAVGGSGDSHALMSWVSN